MRYNLHDFFKWVKGTKLVELDDIDVSEDPVRPELTLGFRITNGRKIFGLQYDNNIEAIVCVAFCPEVPFTVREMDYMSRVENGMVDLMYIKLTWPLSYILLRLHMIILSMRVKSMRNWIHLQVGMIGTSFTNLAQGINKMKYWISLLPILQKMIRNG